MDSVWFHAWHDRGGDGAPLEKLDDEALDTFIALTGPPTDEAAADVRTALLEWCYGGSDGPLEPSRVERLCEALDVVAELDDAERAPAGSPDPSDDWIATDPPDGAKRLTDPREPVDVSDSPEGGGGRCSRALSIGRN